MQDLKFSDPNFIHKFRKLSLKEKKETMERLENKLEFIKANIENKKINAYEYLLGGNK